MFEPDSSVIKKLPRKKNSVAVTHPHLVSEWADERDISTVTHGSDYKAQWKCQKAGHVYYMLVNKRAGRGNSCPYCSGKRAFPGETDISTTHPHLIDGEREHRLNYSPKRFRERSDLLYGEGLTERDLAALNGLERLWGCGSSLWTKNL